MNASRISLIFSILSLTSCSTTNKHASMAGSVAMKIDASHGVACLFGAEPQLGDRLELLKTECTGGANRDASSRECKAVSLGEATITKMLNDHYAEFETRTQVMFEEGSIIKKVRPSGK